ncbi:hypothetical protein A9404_02920 [Halothiobacillus diazotrophicus]|uniref:YqcC-like domain-containing protein n=1 Tax=Halothiobacillus diazotrophicus TaxID=1860122 RepID=A0A191ZF16_9GAMM|nr:YqcC family protein [Halothiobacillus diazotrophicus]ANJ66471.1 hypothetical protein A9404_02920 [Halothiobacillus diazotrophicus]
MHPEAEKPSTAELLERLRAIEHGLITAGLDTPQPAISAFRSTAPFCFDTMTFHEWLRWVFLPRMTQAVHDRVTLPAACAIAPLAEYRFAEMQEHDTDALLALLVEFDVVANRYFQIQETGIP